MKPITTFTGTALLMLTLGLLISSQSLKAQSEEQIERFKQERYDYYNENLDLSEAEKEAFWPLYDDFSNRKMKLMEDERSTFWYAQSNADNLSEAEISDLLAKIRKIKREIWELEELYYGEKFPEVLSAKKVMKLYKVEWDYRRHLLKGIRGQGQGQGKGRGRMGGGQGPAPAQLPASGA
jgi:hypothetical protein